MNLTAFRVGGTCVPMLLHSYHNCLVPEVDICGQCGINVELNLGDAGVLSAHHTTGVTQVLQSIAAAAALDPPALSATEGALCPQRLMRFCKDAAQAQLCINPYLQLFRTCSSPAQTT